MNIKTINIRNYEKALMDLSIFKSKNYGSIDIKIENLYLRKLNKLINQNVFMKNDAYITAGTLWSIMQTDSGIDEHHHHGLTENDILDGLRTITEPHLIIQAENNRYLIVSLFICSFGTPLMIVIEINASLTKNKEANIYKIVTIYPKDNIDKIVEKLNVKDILYKK